MRDTEVMLEFMGNVVLICTTPQHCHNTADIICTKISLVYRNSIKASELCLNIPHSSLKSLRTVTEVG